MNQTPEAIYHYRDERGAPLFEVCRFPGKDFRQRRPDGTWGLGATRRVLYHLPRVREHIAANSRTPIYIVEGEKDVIAIEKAGGVATCNPMGAGKWLPEHSEALKGARRVVVVVDRDEPQAGKALTPGEQHATMIREGLASVGLGETQVEFVCARTGKDAADHLAAGGSLSDFMPFVWGAVAAVASDTKTYTELLRAYQEERRRPEWEPVRLGFGSIDTTIRGISPGQVLGFAARTSVGKTWMLQAVEHNFSIRHDAGCLSMSLEMPGPEWAERAAAIHEGVAPSEIEAWVRQPDFLQRLKPFLDRMRHVMLVERTVKLEEVPDLIIEAQGRLQVPLRLVLIDYLGLLKVQGRDAYERTSRLGIELKQIAKQSNVAVIVAIQLSRAGGNGSEPVSLDMLRDSGVLEESVDFLLGAWQPGRATGLSKEDQENLRDVLRVQVLKSRKGGDGAVCNLRFHPDSRRLYEPAELEIAG